MHPHEFWELSFLEVNDILESHEREEVKRLKKQTISHCDLGYILTANSGIINEDKKLIKPWDIYPTLFEEEKALYDQRIAEEEFEEYKQRRKEYAEALNARRREV